MPAKYRTRYEAGVVITEGIERCLLLFPVEVWTELAEKAGALPLTYTTALEFKRQFLGSASHSVPDKQGRVTLPPELREYANLEGQAVFIGMHTYCEIWDPEIRRVRRAEGDVDDEARVRGFASLGI